MKTLIFATGNKDKLKEASSILPLKVSGIDLEIDEVQSSDLIYIAEKKVAEAFRKIKKPVFIDDVGVFFPALKGFPGPYAKHFLDALGQEKISTIIHGEKDKTIMISCVIAYHDGDKVHSFRGDVEGVTAQKPKGKDGWAYDLIFIPDGYSKTYAELGSDVKNKISHRSLALAKFKKFLDSEAKKKKV